MRSLALSTLPNSTYRDFGQPTPGTGLVAQMSAVPAHLGPIVEILTKLASLPPGWNSYKAKPPAPRAIRQALQLLVDLDWGGPLPTVSPTSTGGIQLEWGDDDAGVELELHANGKIRVLVDTNPNNRWERVVNDVRDPRLQEALIWAEKLA
jgi:hypothetical protein